MHMPILSCLNPLPSHLASAFSDRGGVHGVSVGGFVEGYFEIMGHLALRGVGTL